jgi:hypothetical protein
MRLHGRSKAREYARPNEIAGVLDVRVEEGDSKKEGSMKTLALDRAKQVYDTQFFGFARSDYESLEIARIHYAYHACTNGRRHFFTAAEIRSGVCECDECKPRGEKTDA